MTKINQNFSKSSDSARYNISGHAENLPKGYDPATDQDGYMNPNMLAYFWQKMFLEREELRRQIADLQGEIKSPIQGPEAGEMVSNWVSHRISRAQLAPARQQEAKLTRHIDDIELNGTRSQYGYSVLSGEEIGIGRMKAILTATVTIQEQQELERFQPAPNAAA